MVVKTIYVTRHGLRGNWTVDPSTGVYTTNIHSPTNIVGDPPLVAYGVQQSQELADALTSISPPIAQIYSSCFYRCFETIRPTAEKLGLEIRGDNGLGEWFGRASFTHPHPASPQILSSLFPLLSKSYTPSCFPTATGESVEELHTRCAFALSYIISHADAESGDDPVAIVICTHAAPLIAIGRVLTGSMPSEVGEEDFHTFTAGITKFERRKEGAEQHGRERVQALEEGAKVPPLDWVAEKGQVGGWWCAVNCDCSHLKGGGERGWYFSGDEAFTNTVMQNKDTKL